MKRFCVKIRGAAHKLPGRISKCDQRWPPVLLWAACCIRKFPFLLHELVSLARKQSAMVVLKRSALDL